MWSRRCATCLLALTCLAWSVAGQQTSRRPPNILFVLMDDLGYSDVGYRDGRFHTPTLDGLWNSDSAIRFNRSYTPPNCGPSRAALLSGIYPWRLGLQGNAIDSRSDAAIPLKKTILPQALQEAGYQTHLVGKWHQGFCKKAQTPTKRGFDSFFGFYLTKQDYFSHMSKKNGYDFRLNDKVDYSVEGQYSTTVYSQRVQQLLQDYKDSVDSEGETTKPFFILLSHAAIHGPNQVPQHYIDNHCTGIDADDTLRREKCGMMAAVDEGLKNITDTLRDLSLMDNLLVVFTSDDGGKVEDGSSNFPLRGSKRPLWEGGIRVNTFMYSEDRQVLPETDVTYDGLFYNTDFYATLMGLVNDDTDTKKLPSIGDSLNQWRFLKRGLSSKSYRNYIYYVDQNLGSAMVINGKWKLLREQDRQPDWYNLLPGEVKPEGNEDLDKLSKYQLFDLDSDPRETTNLKDKYPDIKDKLARRLRKVRDIAANPIDVELNSHPRQFNDTWSPGWC